MQKSTTLALTIEGDMPAKKNRYRMGRGRLYQHEDVKAWIEGACWQIKVQLPPGYTPISSKIELQALFRVKRDRDIDNLQNTLLDTLQAAHVLANDKLVSLVVAQKHVCTPGERPGVDVSISEAAVGSLRPWLSPGTPLAISSKRA